VVDTPVAGDTPAADEGPVEELRPRKPRRIWVAPARLMMTPARALGRSSRARGAVRSGVESVTASAGGALEAEAGRVVDAVLAGPLPEAVARSLVDRRVVERIVADTLARGDLERIVGSASTDERTERLVKQVLESPATERILGDALDSRLTLELTNRLLRSPELQRVIEDAVRAGLARQTETLVDTMAASAHHLDAVVEAAPRRWLRRAPRPPAAGPGLAAPVPYAGLGSRAAAFLVDAAIVHFAFLLGCAMFILVAGLVGWNPSHLLADGIAGVGWTVVVATYFVWFWTAAGQTPGMRLMRLRILDVNGAPPSAGRSVLRLVGAAVAATFLIIGFLPVLVDDRRRALQDFLARTVVVYEYPPPISQPATREQWKADLTP
jgi:uncharacterized RDD family membrane protein YckC